MNTAELEKLLREALAGGEEKNTTTAGEPLRLDESRRAALLEKLRAGDKALATGSSDLQSASPAVARSADFSSGTSAPKTRRDNVISWKIFLRKNLGAIAACAAFAVAGAWGFVAGITPETNRTVSEVSASESEDFVIGAGGGRGIAFEDRSDAIPAPQSSESVARARMDSDNEDDDEKQAEVSPPQEIAARAEQSAIAPSAMVPANGFSRFNAGGSFSKQTRTVVVKGEKFSGPLPNAPAPVATSLPSSGAIVAGDVVISPDTGDARSLRSSKDTDHARPFAYVDRDALNENLSEVNDSYVYDAGNLRSGIQGGMSKGQGGGSAGGERIASVAPAASSKPQGADRETLGLLVEKGLITEEEASQAQSNISTELRSPVLSMMAGAQDKTKSWQEAPNSRLDKEAVGNYSDAGGYIRSGYNYPASGNSRAGISDKKIASSKYASGSLIRNNEDADNVAESKRISGDVRDQPLESVNNAGVLLDAQVDDDDSTDTMSVNLSDSVPWKLKKIKIPTVTFRDAPLSRVIETLSELSAIYDPDSSGGVNMVRFFPEGNDPKISVSLRNMSLDKILEVITKTAGADYTFNNELIEVRPVTLNDTKMEYFSVSVSQLQTATGTNLTGKALEGAFKDRLQRAGVPFSGIEGSALIYTDGKLIVTQTPRNLEKIKNLIRNFNVSSEEKNTPPAKPKKEQQKEPAKKVPQPSELPTDPRPEVQTAENPFSTFSLNVSDASFRLAAEALRQGRWPERDSLRTEEFVNAVKLNDAPPSAGEAVAVTQEQARHPFAHNRNLLRLSVQTASAGRDARTPLNITVLLDTSGSMERADRQETLKVALDALADNLSAGDTVGVVGFARTPRVLANQTAGAEGIAQLRNIAGNVPPEGGTNLETALQAAYAVNRTTARAGTQNSVLLLTDGAANLGDARPENLSRIIEQNKKAGIGLNCYGVGFDNYNDTMLEALSRAGNGRYAYLNNAEEAREDFAKKLAGALQVAAQNVKVQVEFNPARVNAYRLLGYEKHRLKKEEFRDNNVKAAEIGAAESGTAIYSVETKPDGTGDIGIARVRYQNPKTGEYIEREWDIPYNPVAPAFEDAPAGVRLAGSAALLAEHLQGAESAETVDLPELMNNIAGANRVLGNFPENRKLQQMVNDAARLEK